MLELCSDLNCSRSTLLWVFAYVSFPAAASLISVACAMNKQVFLAQRMRFSISYSIETNAVVGKAMRVGDWQSISCAYAILATFMACVEDC